MGGSRPAQMIAPLKTKLIGVEIGKAHDNRIERLSDVIRDPSRRHHAAACACGFSER
jgi:hypothetical protein